MADTGKASEINRAAAENPKEPRMKPAGGGKIDGGSPSEATALLKSGRPPHNPMAGLHPRGSHGR